MIFLDNNATTPLIKEVLEAMLFDYDGIPRNPSSVTRYGREAKQKILKAKDQIAAFFSISPSEIIFTSSATESNHLLISGFYARNPGTIITTKLEHASALEPIKRLKAPITYLEVGEEGAPTKEVVEKALMKNASFIFLSGSNSETGALLELEEISDLAEFYNIPLLIDGVQLLGKANFTPLPKGIAGISFSAHKCHGPKGIGLSILRKTYKIPPIFVGGHQENDMRAGTENLAGILGFAKALSLITPDIPNQIQELRDYFEKEMLQRFPFIEVNAHKGDRISNTSNLYFPGIDAESLLIRLDQDGVIASLGSACSSGSLEPSHVLLGMGYSSQRALSSIRFSLSRLTTKEEIDRALSIIGR